MIEELEKLDVKSKYEQIISSLNSLIRYYNQSLKNEYESFKKKIMDHKTSLETNIKQYIEKINKSLTNHSSCFKKFIQSIKNIESQIENFDTNFRQIGQFNQYLTKDKLIKLHTRIEKIYTTHFEKIFDTHELYKQCLSECTKIKYKLSPIVEQLKHYSDQFVKKTINSDLSKLTKNNIDEILHPLEGFKAHVDKFDSYLGCVGKLEEIGEHIRTMKSELRQVEDKVDDKAKTYINDLKEISITQSEVQSSIEQIKKMNKVIIDRLKIAKHTIEFYKSLESAINNLNGVTFNDYDFTLYWTVKGKVESFESEIKSKLSNVKQEIDKIKEQIQGVSKDGVKCDGETQQKQDDDPISKVEKCINGSIGDIPNIIKFINNSLKEVERIKDLVTVIQDRKKESETYLTGIKCNVDEITRLEGATTKLAKVEKELRKFVGFQENTKSLIDQFSTYYKFGTLSRLSKPLQDVIDYSKILIGYVNYYSDYLKTVGNVDSLITEIKCYNSRFESIKGIIQNFKAYVYEIIGRVETINSNLLRLKWFQCYTGVENNLWRLKRYMKGVKWYLTNIRENFSVIISVIDKIKQDISKIDTYKCELKCLEEFIEGYINCYKKNSGLIGSVKDYLEKLKDKLNEILIVKNMIINCSHIDGIKKIESKLESVESSVSELECAIEGEDRKD